MVKNAKMSTLIAVCIGVVTLICMVFLFIVSNNNTKSIMRSTAVSSMMTSLDAQSSIIEQYVDAAERTLKEYSTAKVVKDAIQNPDNAACIKDAQEYTDRYYANLGKC